tara:strand:+ start:196 stop:765 length:570 start_codon:yes stop_codon:yes gene_type:complete
MIKNINCANFLSCLRIVVVPILVILFFISDQSPRIFLVFIFTIACLTDYLDGYVARKMNQVSDLGKFLDPVADKLLVITSLLLVLFDYNSLIIFIPICIIVIREVLVSALREWVAISNLKSTFSKGKTVDVNYIGKIKTFIQMLSIGFLLFDGSVFTIDTYMIGLYGIYLAAFLSLISMIIYLGNVIRS